MTDTAVIIDNPVRLDFNAATFFDVIRAELFNGTLNQEQVDGHNEIAVACDLMLPHDEVFRQNTSYCFGTFYWETAQTMQPIEEYGKGNGKDYYPWYGRGYVQLTWEENYQKQQDKMGQYAETLGLYDIPWRVHDDKTLALNPSTSGIISVRGMYDGDFTGVGLPDYIKPGMVNYVEARRIVNGTDKQYEIAEFAQIYERAFAAGYGED